MNKLLNNTKWILISQIFQMVIGFFVGMFAIRYLGPTNYGSITYINSYVSFFSALSSLGLETVVIYQLVHHKDREGEVIASAIFLRIVVSVLCIIALLAVVMVVDHGDHELLIISLLSGTVLIFKSFMTIGFWYQYKLLSKRNVIGNMAAFTIATVYRIYALANGKSVYWFAFYETFVYMLDALFYVQLFRKDCHQKRKISKEMCSSLLKLTTPYLISAVMISLYSQVDRIMIKQLMDSTAEVGLYSAATNICVLIAFIPNSISISARPVLMEMKHNQSENYEKRLIQVLASIIWVSIIYSIFVLIFADLIVNILYGSQYSGAAGAMRILVWVTLVQNLTQLRDLWLIGENQSKYVTIFSITGTLFNILLNLLLIPTHGIIGASVATVATEFFVMLGLPLICKDTRQFGISVLYAICLKDVKLSELYHEVIDAIIKKRKQDKKVTG